jgi:hypothetical protein
MIVSPEFGACSSSEIACRKWRIEVLEAVNGRVRHYSDRADRFPTPCYTVRAKLMCHVENRTYHIDVEVEFVGVCTDIFNLNINRKCFLERVALFPPGIIIAPEHLIHEENLLAVPCLEKADLRPIELDSTRTRCNGCHGCKPCEACQLKLEWCMHRAKTRISIFYLLCDLASQPK